MNELPNYYSIVPATVRYCKELSPQEKLLYSEITALTNYKGYCWATNNYFANLYELSKKTISRQINNLAELGFIHIKMIYAENSNQIIERRIYLPDPNIHRVENNTASPILKNVYTPIDKNEDRGIDKNEDTPIPKNAEDNNTSINNTSINISNLIVSDQSLENEVKEKTDSIGYDMIPTQSVLNKKEKKNKESFQNTTSQSIVHSMEPSDIEYNYTEVEEIIKNQISYNYLIEDKIASKDIINEVLSVIVSTICTKFKDGYISMKNELVPAETVKSIFFKLTYEHIDYFIDCFKKQTKPITRMKSYIRRALYENYSTANHHITNRVYVDMPELAGRKI